MAEIEGLLPYYQAAQGESDLPANQWQLNFAKKHAVQLFSDFDALDETNEKIVPDRAEPETVYIDNFSEQADSVFFHTKIVSNDVGGEAVELDLKDRILTLAMDASGSATWNDNRGMRYAVAKRLVNRVSSTYPGDISYNLITFGGKPVNVTLFAVLETSEINSNNVQAVSSSFFQEEVARFAGIRVVRREGTYPASPLDGEVVSEGFFHKAFDDELTEGKTYYYKVFTYDKDFNFSKGVPIHVTPRDRQIPRGVARVGYDVLSGSGVARDEFTRNIWHFDEGTGTRLYDFTGNADLSILDQFPIWLSLKEVPVGESGLRFDGVMSGASADDMGSQIGDGNTIMFWVYPYDASREGVIYARQSDSSTNCIVYLNANGGISVSMDGAISFDSDDASIVENAWNHVAVTIAPNEIKFYVNGVLVGDSSAAWVTSTLTDAKTDIGFDRLGTFSRFFGKLKEVSVHSVVRDQNYIIEQSFADDSDDLGGLAPARKDNGDRLVVIRYEIPDDYNFVDGSVEIIKKELSQPSWEGEGIALASKPATPGSFYVTDASDFVLDETYYYRLWSKNAIGNYSFIEDSPLLEIAIPAINDTEREEPDAIPQPVSSVTSVAGNKKVFLKWKSPLIDPTAVRIRIYKGTSGYPVISSSEQASSQPIFVGLLDDEQFLDLFDGDDYLTNGQTYFYTIVTADRFGNVSNPVNIQVTPQSDADETQIPLLDVKEIGYEIVNDEAVSLRWTNPIEFRSDLKGWFDQRVFIYAAVTDDFGQPISDETRLTLNIGASVTAAGLAEDVFNDFEILETRDPSDYYVFGVTRVGPGVVRGTLRMNGDLNLVSQLDRINFQVQLFANVPDASSRDASGNYSDNLFEFYSEGISIELQNPWKLELVNRDNRSVSEECEIDPRNLILSTEIGNELGPEVKTFPGAYIRSKNPFVARVKLSFRDEPLTAETSVRVAVYDATANLCGEPFLPVRLNQSTTVLPPATTLQVVRGFETTPDGQREISYVDVPLTVPRLRQMAFLYAQAEYNGYRSTKALFMLFQNILQIDLNAEAPIANGQDVAEQSASVYLLDPDFPTDESRRTLVPDLTITRWDLTIGLPGLEVQRTRPFYSTDAVPAASGVFSYIRSGTARNVFFGPAAGVVWTEIPKAPPEQGTELVGERYAVSAHVQYDGMTATKSEPIEIYPLTLGRGKPTAGILMEMPEFQNVFWSDGIDYVKMVISKDPNDPSDQSKYAGCFQTCVGEIFAMQTGQTVDIYAGHPDVEILWGEVHETIDPYTGEKSLELGEDGFIANERALIEMGENKETVVYFRGNIFVPPPPEGCPCEETLGDLLAELSGGRSRGNPCKCLGIENDCKVRADLCTEYVVTGSTAVLVAGQVEAISGGGDIKTGIPPTILVPEEPLSIRFVGIRAGGVPSNTFVLDGVTANDIVVEVSFAGRPVPKGTPVFVNLVTELEGGNSRISINAPVIYTETRIDEDFDATTERSYASVTVAPLTSQNGLYESILFTATYDRLGTVNREREICVTVKWELEDASDNEGLDVYSASLYAHPLPSPLYSSDEYGGIVYNEGNIREIYGISPSLPLSFNIDPANPFTNTYASGDDEWRELSPMSHPRAGLILASNFDMLASIIRSNGPLNYYRFAEIVGPNLVDEVGGATGAYIGNPVMWSVGGLNNSQNTAVTFDGATQYCESPATFDPTSDFTFIIVAKAEVIAASTSVIVTQIDGSGNGRSPLFIDSNGKYATNLGGSNNSTTIAPSGDYDFIAGVYDADSGIYSLLINGNLTEFNIVTEACDGSLLIGCGKMLNNFFKGAIDEIALFQKAVPVSELDRMYEAFQQESKLYAIGGLDSKTISKYNEVYILDEDKWTDATSIPTPRFGAMSATVNGKVYVIGGITADVVSKQLRVTPSVEAYDMLTDEWELLAPMPVLDNGSVDGAIYGVAYGVAQHLRIDDNDYIYILGGMREIGQDGAIRSLNDRVLIYNITADSWAAVEAFDASEVDIYLRVAPLGFSKDGLIYLFGGVVPESSNNGIRYLGDVVVFDIASNTISLSDGAFSTLPVPRYRSQLISDNPYFFAICGSISQSIQSKLFDLIDSLQSPFGFQSLNPLPKALSDVGASLNASIASPFYNNKWAFVVGGFKSGRGDGFCQIRTEYSPARVRLDGKQSSAISVKLVQDDGSSPSRPVKVRVRGFLRFDPRESVSNDDAQADQSEARQRSASRIVDERISIYPVLFADDEILTNESGEGRFTLLPRSDDVLQGAETIAKRLGLTTKELEDRFGIGKGQQLSDDTLIIQAGVDREPYQIVVELTIIDSFYYGQTIEEIPNQVIEDESEEPEEGDGGEQPGSGDGGEDSDNPCKGRSEDEEPDPDPDEPGITPDPPSGETFEELCQNGVVVGVTTTWESFSQGVDTSGIPALQPPEFIPPDDEDQGFVGKSGVAGASDEDASGSFLLRPPAFGQHNSPVLAYYSDIEWIPIIDILVGGNAGTAAEILERLDNLHNEIPFGASAMLDALVAAAQLLSDNAVDELTKSIYLFTDNESNMSFSTLSETIAEINAIDGELKVPVIVGNFAVVKPVTLSARANSSDTDDLNTLAEETGGQSVSVLSEDFEDEIVQIFVGEAIGAMGYGTYSFLLDLGGVVDIRRMSALFNLFENTNGNWTFSYSNDGFSFIKIGDTYRANADIAFTNLSARYLSFEIALLTGFTASNSPEYETVPLPSSPSLTSIEIEYETRKITYLFLKSEEVPTVPQQVAVAVNGDYVEPTDIEIGVATSDSHNWLDYQGPAQKARYSNGKVFIPLRSYDDFSEVPTEPLEKLDKHTFVAKFGRWDPTAAVQVLEPDGSVVPAELYRVFPREGIVVFASRRVGDYRIRINNQGKLRVGLKLTNRSSENPLEVEGVAYMYNTNVSLLPPLERIAPELANVLILPDDPTVYSTIEARYDYRDRNGEPEDVSQREIRWYVNGRRIQYLDNLTKWNDISDPNDPLFSNALTFTLNDLAVGESAIARARENKESIVKVGDSVFYTIRVSDGELFSEATFSNTVVIEEDKPQLEELTILAQQPSGAVSTTVTSRDTAFVDYSVLGDTDTNQSEIAWYLNGVEFKRGVVGDVEGIDRVLSGEQTPDGDVVLVLGNEIFVEITPQTTGATGDAQRSDPIIVRNAPPVVTNARIGPSNPRVSQNLVLTYTFTDTDITLGDTTQSDLSTIKWFKKATSQQQEFQEVKELQNQLVIESSNLRRGEIWTAVIIPFDGFSEGEQVTANSVTIR